jgi:hypothetical protein
MVGFYKISTPNFPHFLCMLGMRTYLGSGKDKEAFKALKAEAAERGWRTGQ